MIKRIIGLTILLLAGIMIASLRGQNSDATALEQEAQKQQQLSLPEVPHELCHKDFLRFWRLTLDGHKGNWHLYNEEDHRFLSDMQVRIKNGQYVNSRIEWVAMEGRLPK
jgi:hypothetical protein